jgi:DNA-binding Xre family transcriptional regulator
MSDPLNNRLAELMDAKQVSSNELAGLLGVTEDTIGRFRANRGGPIPSKYIPTLAAELEVEPSHLMGWDRTGATA